MKIMKNLNGTGNDTIEVRLRDNTYRVYFEAKADLNNPRKMKQLTDDLRAKGVKIPINWFD